MGRPRASSRRDCAPDTWQALQRCPQALGLVGGVMHQSEGCSLPQEGYRLENVFRGSSAETRQLRQTPVLGRRFEFGKRVYTEDFVNLADFGDSKPGDLEHLHQTGRAL